MNNLVPITPSVRAAQYLRMSTEHQRYSLANQSAAIGLYAALHGFHVVRTYSDAGKSGLSLKRRDGLKTLLSDVVVGNVDFEAILVLDVSRWGRFQDPDQAAHYEFMCREAGLQIHYCAEPFDNDGTLVSSIVKNVKRLMAAEYSRDLSERISRTKRRSATLGFSQGGRRPYGVQRVAIDSAGQDRAVLEDGERRVIENHRTVYRTGDPSEVATIRKIFTSYLRQRMAPKDIAKMLNSRGCCRTSRLPWTGEAIRKILRSPLYCGVYVYGKTSRRLLEPTVSVPAHNWVKVPADTGIVSKRVFLEAQKLDVPRKHNPLSRQDIVRGLKRLLEEEGKVSAPTIDRCSYLPSGKYCLEKLGGAANAYAAIGWNYPITRTKKLTDDEIIAGLSHVLADNGFLTTRVVDADPRVPNATTLAKRFGTVRNAFALAGYDRTWSETNKAAHYRTTGGRFASTRTPFAERQSKVPEVCLEADTQLSTDFMVGRLRAVHTQHGHISGNLINDDPLTPSIGTYRRKFGSLSRAYELAGLPHTKSAQNRAAHAARKLMRCGSRPSEDETLAV